ncbi:MAG: hypothetical protein ACOY4H_05685 [Thermodesulfobacteriota bacterium]
MMKTNMDHILFLRMILSPEQQAHGPPLCCRGRPPAAIFAPSLLQVTA